MKAFSPGPEVEVLDNDLVLSYGREADEIIMNDREYDVLRERGVGTSQMMQDEEDTLVVTSDDEVRVHQRSGVTAYDVDNVENPVDTIGAGDAFSTNYVVSRAQGKSLEACVRDGIDQATKIVRRLGATPWKNYRS